MPDSNDSPPVDRQDLLARLEEALARIEEVPCLDESRYLETHDIYEGRSDQRQGILEWFGRRVAPGIATDRPFRVLSVGCGSGQLDVPLAARLADRANGLTYVGVNPNRTECEAFERLFCEASIPGAQLEVVPANFDAFHAPASFDLVHFVHSLYYLPDAAVALEKARKLLAPGGRLVLFHAPREAMNDLAARFWDKHFVRQTPFAEDVAKLLDRWGWSYQRGRVEAAVEVAPLMNGDAEIGLALRDFIIQADSRRLPRAARELVDRYLRLIAIEEGDGTHIPHPVDVFLTAG